MSPGNTQVMINDHEIQVVDEYVYLGHIIKLGKVNQTAEITKRINV